MNEQEIEYLKGTLKGKKILLGITGSIAAFKAIDVIRYLKKAEAEVQVIATESALSFVTATTIETISGRPLKTKMFGGGDTGTHHIDLARWADCFVIIPATANTVAKIAHGLADDLLTTELLAFKGPVLVAPAMNPTMLASAAVQTNLKILQDRDVQVISPDRGITSCGEEGEGRLPEPNVLVEKIAEQFYPRLNKKLLITLGPTRSPIDPVRYLTNRSSGKMGAALCWAAVAQGYEVHAICGPSEVKLPSAVKATHVETASEMANAVKSYWKSADIYVGAAAISDWRAASISDSKIKKSNGKLDVEFVHTEDVLAWVGAEKAKHQKVYGFAAETDDVVASGKRKLENKKCDGIFINDISMEDRGFESDTNAGWWISKGGSPIELDLQTKFEIARRILEQISKDV